MKINGREYNFRLDLYAMEMVEEEFGDIKTMLAELNGANVKITSLRKLFRIMGNAYQSYTGRPEDITGDEIKHMPITQIKDLSLELRSAIEHGFKVETINGGEADDDTHDVYLEEINRAEKKADALSE